MTNLQVFMITIKEYRRFADQLPINKDHIYAGNYSDSDYVAVQTRLMLLRKYFTNNSNVYLNRLIRESIEEFPEKTEELSDLIKKNSALSTKRLMHILSDGTKQNLVETITDTVYGLYLHADESKINRLMKTSESLRYACIGEYIVEFEELILELEKILTNCQINSISKCDEIRAPVIFLGDATNRLQSIKSSSYWSNMYGYDATDSQIKKLVDNLSDEDKLILNTCIIFFNEISKTKIDVKKLKKYIFPPVQRDWGDYSDAKKYIRTIPNPAISQIVRYKEDHKIAYVRIIPNVSDSFIVESPHIVEGIYEFSLAKWFGKWKIFSFGEHLESLYK